ncbi:hypothetical protein [Acinetobacter sp. A47]|uniref:hypothetical protein n=1 Tax=Acinetobacter sp. A47 TaxID=1561217 RepID=UPI00056F5965|nr:hypothetical protein [Acinetobacter sp. A47]
MHQTCTYTKQQAGLKTIWLKKQAKHIAQLKWLDDLLIWNFSSGLNIHHPSSGFGVVYFYLAT